MYRPFPGAERVEPSAEEAEMFEWAAARGAKWPKIEYPVRFPPGYIGSMAKEDILPGESIVSAPNRCLMTTNVAKNSELKEIFESNPSLFNPESGYYEDYLLSTYMLFEKSKGRSSEWYPFIAYQSKEPSNLQDWTPEELLELQDPDLQYDTKKSRESHENSWEKWRKILLNYPEKFPEQFLSLAEYTWAIRLIGTRTFGKFAPYVTFFPVGELLNHDNVQSFYSYLRPEEQADSSKRYSGRDNNEDHDGWIYEVNESFELNCQIWGMISYMINNSENDALFDEIRVQAEKLDKKVADEEEVKRKYRPDDIDLSESDDKEMRISAGPTETYQAGSEVYMSYGRYSNRQLLSVYGFSLNVNKFNFALVKTQIKDLMSPEMAKRVVFEDLTVENYIKFKLKEFEFSNEMLSTLRRVHWKVSNPVSAFFKPEVLSLEATALGKGLELLRRSLNSYPSTLEEDLGLLRENLPLRKYFAVLYRSQIKQIIANQIDYFTAALNIVNMTINSNNPDAKSHQNIAELKQQESSNWPNGTTIMKVLEDYLLELGSN